MRSEINYGLSSEELQISEWTFRTLTVRDFYERIHLIIYI